MAQCDLRAAPTNVRSWESNGLKRTRRLSAVHDRPCVKTHTSAKCRKHNSPARHRTSRVQYDLTLRDAIARRYFHVWRDRWSFRTAKTRSRHKPGRNLALQRGPDLIPPIGYAASLARGGGCNSVI